MVKPVIITLLSCIWQYNFVHHITMNRLFVIVLMIPLCLASACDKKIPQNETLDLCASDWYQSVELAFPTADGMGHGPDIGSAEWRSVIEFRLGIRGNTDVPDRSSAEWCRYIDGLIHD